MSTIARRACSAANRRTIAWPIPLAAPVTTATWPASPLKYITTSPGPDCTQTCVPSRRGSPRPRRPSDGRSFDDPVRPREDGGRDGQPQGLRGLRVDHQLELGRLLDRKIARLRPLED